MEDIDSGDTMEDEPLATISYFCVHPDNKKWVAYVTDYSRLGLLYCHTVAFKDKASAEAMKDVFTKAKGKHEEQCRRATMLQALSSRDAFGAAENQKVQSQINAIMGATIGIHELQYLGLVPIRQWVHGDPQKKIPPVVRPEVVHAAVAALVQSGDSDKKERRLSFSRRQSVSALTGTPVIMVLSTEGIRAVATETREELVRSFIKDVVFELVS